MTGSRRLEAADARVLAGLLLLPLVLFAEAVSGRRVFYERDIHAYWHPKVESFVRVLAQGALPLWDPYTAFGQPLLADPGSQVYYPFTWLNLLFLPATVYTIAVAAHAWLAAAGAFMLGRAWGLSRPAAVVTAVCFASSGPFLSTVSLYHHYMGAAWMPLVLVALEEVLTRRTRGATVALAALVAVQVVAGSGDMVVLTGLASLVRLAAAFGGLAAPAVDRPALLRVALAGLLGLGASAAQWVPTVDLLRRSSRAAMPIEANLYWSVHPAGLIELLLPRAMADLPLSESVRAAVFESREPFLPSLYLGLVPALLLVPLAGVHDRRRAGWAAAGAAIFLIAALGRHTPVLPLVLRLPGFSWFRYPVKYTIALALFWALLAGLGLEAWRGAWPPSARRRAWGVAAAAIVFALAALLAGEWVRVHARELARWVDAPPDWRPAAYAPLVAGLRRAAAVAAIAGLLAAGRARGAGRPVAMAMIAAAALDLVTAGRRANDLAPRELITSRPPVLRLLGDPLDAHRLYAAPVSTAWLNHSLVRGPAGWTQQWSWALGLQESLQAPIGARWGLRGSYDADFTGLAPDPQPTMAALMGRYQETGLGLRLLRMGGVTDVVAPRRVSTPALVAAGEVPTVFAEPVRVYRVPAPFPRAYVVGQARIAAGAEALRTLGDPGFDPERAVLLAQGTALEGGGEFAGRARIVEATPDRWRVETETTQPGYLVVLEADDAGWRATLDGARAPIRRANILFRAVELPAGTHTVVMRYRPRPVLAGLGVSITAMVALFVTARAPRRAPVSRGA